MAAPALLQQQECRFGNILEQWRYSSCIAGISLERISRAMIPFLLAAIVVLLLVTYISSLAMWIPQLYLQR